MELYKLFSLCGWIALTLVNSVITRTFDHLPRRLIPPQFHATPTNVTYEKGSLAILYCSIDNLGTKTVTWRKQPYNVPITVGREQFVKINRFYLSVKNVQWNLLIKNVQPFDAGTYECQISSTTKILRRNITLNVIENGRSFKQEIDITGTRFVEKGASIFLMCNASGITSPPDGIDWFKDGNLLTSRHGDDRRIDKQISYSTNVIVSTLTIRNSKMSDTGTYVCRTSELLTDRFKVDVLNAKTFNVKREYEELSHGENSYSGGLYYGRSTCSDIGHFSVHTVILTNIATYVHTYILYR